MNGGGEKLGAARELQRHAPVWMMMCLERSPTLTKALLQTVHLWGRMLSWWRMWLASWLDCTNLSGTRRPWSGHGGEDPVIAPPQHCHGGRPWVRSLGTRRGLAGAAHLLPQRSQT